MSKKLSQRLKKARETFGPHHKLATAIGISPDSLQRYINGEEPKQRDKIDFVNNYLSKKGL